MIAAHNGHKTVAEFLMQNGADVNTTNKNGVSVNSTIFSFQKEKIFKNNM